jgi:type II secretory ATPase GspE/PulE/Tfp pilus assembly ATPase PilB-like protein
MGLSNLLVPLGSVAAGPYVNGLKAIPGVILLLIWTRLMTWVDKDAEVARLPRQGLNAAFLVGLIAAYGAQLFLPTFIVGLLVLIVVLAAELAIYLGLRQKTVGLGDLSEQFKTWANGLFGKSQEVKEVEGAIQLYGSDGAMWPAPTADAPEAEGFAAMQTMLTAPLENGAQVIEFAPNADGATVRYSVDGVVYTGATVAKSAAAAATGYIKDAAGLDINEVRKPQTATLKVAVARRKRELLLTTKGSTAGESARFVVEPKKRHSFTLASLGMPEDQVAAVSATLKDSGLVLLAAPRAHGLTALSYAVLKAHDAFLEHLLTVERDQEQDLEGVTQQALAANAPPEEEAKQVSWIVSQQPDVLLVSKPQSPDTARELIKLAKTKRVYVSFVASDASEALSLWRKLVGEDKLALSQLKMVIAGRLLRKLCVACKQGYTPDPQTLRKLGIDPANVEQLYQAPKQPPVDAKGNPLPCEFCNDLRYKGRTGIYEILIVDDEVRQVIINGGTPAQLKTAFRKQGGRYLQEAGLALVERGETSVQEVLRVLRSDASPGRQKPAA